MYEVPFAPDLRLKPKTLGQKVLFAPVILAILMMFIGAMFAIPALAFMDYYESLGRN